MEWYAKPRVEFDSQLCMKKVKFGTQLGIGKMLAPHNTRLEKNNGPILNLDLK